MAEYVSNLLSHFVGRSLSSDNDKFDLLVSIISKGTLLCTLDPKDESISVMGPIYKGERAGEILEKCNCVCFCDIPDKSLDIHTAKYSKFGIGFDKSFITSCGASPVMYVPKNSKPPVPEGIDFPDTPMEYYIQLYRQSYTLLMLLTALNQAYDFKSLLALLINNDPSIKKLIPFLDKKTSLDIINGKLNQLLFHEEISRSTLFQYIKIFDETLPIDDPENYYMEREWRCTKNVSFKLSDIKKIYLENEDYKDKFMEKFPAYHGKFYIFN